MPPPGSALRSTTRSVKPNSHPRFSAVVVLGPPVPPHRHTTGTATNTVIATENRHARDHLARLHTYSTVPAHSQLDRELTLQVRASIVQLDSGVGGYFFVSIAILAAWCRWCPERADRTTLYLTVQILRESSNQPRRLPTMTQRAQRAGLPISNQEHCVSAVFNTISFVYQDGLQSMEWCLVLLDHLSRRNDMLTSHCRSRRQYLSVKVGHSKSVSVSHGSNGQCATSCSAQTFGGNGGAAGV